MLESLSVRPRICEQIRSGPPGAWVDDFVEVLATRGYARSVIRRHVRSVAIFGAWLERQGLAAVEVDEAIITGFVSELPRCQAPGRRHGRVSEVAGGFGCSPDIWPPRVWCRAGRRQPLGTRLSNRFRTSTSTSCRCTAWSSGRGASTGVTPPPSWPSAWGHRHRTGPGLPFRRLLRSCGLASADSVLLRVETRRPPRARCCASW